MTIDGRWILPTERQITIQDTQVITLLDSDMRFRITAVAGAAPRLSGFTVPNTNRILWVYNGSGATLSVGNNPTRNFDHEILGDFTFNPNSQLWMMYFNEGPTFSGYRKWVVLGGG